MTTDPNADPFTYDPSSSFYAENPPLGPPDELPLNFTYQLPGHEPNDIFDPFSDPDIWAFCNDADDLPGNFGVGHSGLPGEGPSNPMPVSVVSVPRTQYNCTCCQVLREITHTNGSIVKRLEIHGCFGVITHAVLAIYDFDSSFQMFDFQNESTLTVKKFMVKYFEDCKREGYTTLQDPLSKFYEALSIGLNEPDDLIRLSAEYTDGDFTNMHHEPSQKSEDIRNRVGFMMKPPLSMQRERTRNLRLKDFADCFDLPIEDAARKMNLCPTVVKKICRKNGVGRWPYRKIKSIKRKISKKSKIVDSSDDQEKARALEDIRKHKQELSSIYESFNK